MVDGVGAGIDCSTTYTSQSVCPAAAVHEIVAWFAPSLPYGYGPKSFYGLPGLILELTRIRTTFLATKIVIEDKKELKIKFPVGKTTTKEAFDKQLKAQMGM